MPDYYNVLAEFLVDKNARIIGYVIESQILHFSAPNCDIDGINENVESALGNYPNIHMNPISCTVTSTTSLTVIIPDYDGYQVAVEQALGEIQAKYGQDFNLVVQTQ